MLSGLIYKCVNGGNFTPGFLTDDLVVHQSLGIRRLSAWRCCTPPHPRRRRKCLFAPAVCFDAPRAAEGCGLRQSLALL